MVWFTYLQLFVLLSYLEQCSFQVIKEGTLLENITIKCKQFILIGRSKDICDLQIDNNSVSRKHAIIQFENISSNIYIYDLNSTHGTLVNNNKLPARTYKLIKSFDSIKFGISSRIYILRCIELQSKQFSNNFHLILKQNHQQLSKQEMKLKYLSFLKNDNSHHTLVKSTKLYGSSNQNKDNHNGIDWGIDDERQIYNYRNQHQFIIQPDIIRRLPNLNQEQLNKLAQYEEQMRLYQSIQAQLTEIMRKQKQNYGISEKEQNQKQKYQSKMVEVLSNLEKVQEWLRQNIFGQKTENNKINILLKDIDSYEGDEFIDRTKKNKNQGNNIQQLLFKDGKITTEDYWKIKRELKQKILELNQLKEYFKKKNQIEQSQSNSHEQIDELAQYMRQNNKQLNQENQVIKLSQIASLQATIQRYTEKLKNVMSVAQIEKMKQSTVVIQDLKEIEKNVQENKIRKKQENLQKVDKVMKQLQLLKQQENMNENNIAIFKYYKPEKAEEEEEENYKREWKLEEYHELETFQRPNSKYMNIIGPQRKKQNVEQYEDLTKKYN